MAETANIARIAEKVSSQLFAEFGWHPCAPRNTSWDCGLRERHRTKASSHPSDIVFCYDDPYDAGFVYVTADLKSYAKASIQLSKVSGAIRGLAMATECANVSSRFAELYVSDHQAQPTHVVGLLFVYNHDGEYTGDFARLLAQVDRTNSTLQQGSRMYVMGPAQITYLYSIAQDITLLRGRLAVPPREDCHFYYPDLVQIPARKSKEAAAASLEWLTGPWQMLRFHTPLADNAVRTNTLVYYRDNGSTTDSFKYLLDYLFRFQLIDTGHVIQVRSVPATARQESTRPLFEKAKEEYLRQIHPAGRRDMTERLKAVSYERIETFVTHFDESFPMR